MHEPHYPERVYFNDVVVRDGFQIEPEFVPTDKKIALIDALSTTGLKKLEITSFVSPKAIPNLRDAEEVAQRVKRVPGVTYVALVPNERGCERALACGLDEINLVVSVSPTHNLANMRMTPDESVQRFRNIMQLLQGTTLTPHASLATAFGCPFEGAQAPEAVFAIAQALHDMGIRSMSLADTVGMASPRQVGQLTRDFLARFPDVALTLHFHNTRGMGLANVMAGMHAGATSFDGSLGGLGGCPFAPGATGNICTEDAVHMVQACGVDTGVDLDRLLDVARNLAGIVGHDVPGQVIKAGKSTDTHALPSTVCV